VRPNLRLVWPVVRIETLGTLSQPVSILRRPAPARDSLQQVPVLGPKLRRTFSTQDAAQGRLIVEDDWHRCGRGRRASLGGRPATFLAILARVAIAVAVARLIRPDAHGFAAQG